MGVWQKIKEKIKLRGEIVSSLPPPASRLPAKEAAIPPVGTFRDSDYGFRPLTAQSERDLSALSQERMIEIAYWLYRTNPLAEGVLTTVRDFVVGEGITFESKNPRVQAVLEEFWSDPVNQMELKLEKKVLELGMYGEQCYPVFASQYAGKVRLGYVDPASIKEVVADPENSEVLLGVALKSRGNKKGRRYKAILAGDEEDIVSVEGLKLREDFTDGDCFFFNINNVSNATRGLSDLLNLADWVDGFEQFLFDRLDMRSLVNAFIWDTTIEGKSSEEIAEIAKTMPAPKRGMEFIHNERVKREAVAPDLKADDATADALIFRKHILGAKGFPLPWFGEGGDVNRATAQEMEPRIIKMLSRRQRHILAMIKSIFRYVILTKIRAGELDERVEVFAEGEKSGESVGAVDAFSIVAPDINIKDIERIAGSMQPIAIALLTAETQGWIDKGQASQVFRIVIGQLGVKLEMEKRGQGEDEIEKARRDYGKEAVTKLRAVYGGRR